MALLRETCRPRTNQVRGFPQLRCMQLFWRRGQTQMLMDLSFSPLFTAIDKQKTLLSADVGHFSLVRAMHLADLITLMNGGFPHIPCSFGDF